MLPTRPRIYCSMSEETTKAIRPCRVMLEFEMQLKHLASVSWLSHKGGDSRHRCPAHQFISIQSHSDKQSVECTAESLVV